MNFSLIAFSNFLKPHYWAMALLLLATACKRQHVQKSVDVANAQPEVQKDTLVSPPTTTLPVQPPVVAPKGDQEDFKNKIDEIDFEYLNSQAKVSFKSKDQNIEDANVSIRMKRDSIVWFNVKVFGIDAARAIITKEGLQMMDLYHRVAYQYSFDSLSTQFGVKLDFNLIQAVILGNMPIRKKPREVRREKDYLLLKQNEGKVLVDNYIGEGNRKLKKLLVEDIPTKTSLKMEYDDFQSLNNFLFPYNSLLVIDSQSKSDNLPYQTVIRIKYKKVELSTEALGFPFKVPAGYERK
jgi:hypothetical protein